MNANARDGSGRLPTAGRDAKELDWIDAVRTGDGALIVYSVDDEDAWVQTEDSRSLEAMR